MILSYEECNIVSNLYIDSPIVDRHDFLESIGLKSTVISGNFIDFSRKSCLIIVDSKKWLWYKLKYA